MKKFKRRGALAAVMVVISILILGLFQRLVTPKYMTTLTDGAFIAEYYDETLPHDVLFIGDCEVYENISPITMWEQYGITSYIRGSAQQLIWQSYYLLEESLKYETPRVVVFNVLSMKYGEPQNEAYNRLTLDNMKWSLSKWNAILASMTEEEHAIEYIFPLLRYHSRWNQLTAEDFDYYFTKKKHTHNGYYMRVDTRAVSTVPREKPLPDYQFSDVCYEYLDKMRILCEENGIQFVLMKAPSIYPSWYDEWEKQMDAYAQKHGLTYFNFLELSAETGIDMQTDTYDMGLHLNVNGAEKLAGYLGNQLQTAYSLPDHRADENYQKVWREKTDFYNQMKEDQYKELEEYGYLKSYGAAEPEQN